MPSPGSTRPTRTAQVSAYLAAHGFPGVRLHRSARDAYCHFHGGDADYWHETSVMVPRVSDLTLDQWLAEARTCAATARHNPAHRSGVSMARRRTARRRRTNPQHVPPEWKMRTSMGQGILVTRQTATSATLHGSGGKAVRIVTNGEGDLYALLVQNANADGTGDVIKTAYPASMKAALAWAQKQLVGNARKNPVGMDAMYHALQQSRIPWASFSVDQIKTVAYGAMKNGDNELYDKAVAALARRTR